MRRISARGAIARRRGGSNGQCNRLLALRDDLSGHGDHSISRNAGESAVKSHRLSDQICFVLRMRITQHVTRSTYRSCSNAMTHGESMTKELWKGNEAIASLHYVRD